MARAYQAPSITIAPSNPLQELAVRQFNALARVRLTEVQETIGAITVGEKVPLSHLGIADAIVRMVDGKNEVRIDQTTLNDFVSTPRFEQWAAAANAAKTPEAKKRIERLSRISALGFYASRYNEASQSKPSDRKHHNRIA